MPFWGMTFYKASDNDENRNKMPFKRVKNPRRMNIYILENHAFREEFSKAYFSFMLDVCNESPLPDRVVIGKEGWYYLGDDVKVYSKTLGLIAPDQEKIDRICNVVSEMKLFCDSLGVDFYFAIAPNKGTIYPEYLPLKPNDTKHEKYFVIPQLREKYNINAIDLSLPILEKKDSVRLYYKKDSHWNHYGGFLAAKYLMDSVSESHDVRRLKEEDYDILRLPYDYLISDLTKMLKRKSYDEDFAVERKEKQDVEREEQEGSAERPNIVYVKNRNNIGKSTAFVVRDSFFSVMLNPVSESLSETTFIWGGGFDKQLLLEEIKKKGKPDFILVESVERFLEVLVVK